MDLLHLVDRLEEQIAGAQKMPIGNRSILDRRRMLDLIDQMRVAVPHEFREAQDIVAQREAIRRDAEEEARLIVARAEDRAAQLVEASEITQAARQRAEDIAAEADRRLEQRIIEANQDIQQRISESRRIAREQMQAADDYARELLERLDRQLAAFSRSIQAGIQQLEPLPAPAEGFAPLDDYGFAPAVPVSAPDEPVRYDTYAEDDYEDQLPVDPYADERPEGGTDLENLLRRPNRASAPAADPGPAEPGVIDDFEHEPLDDDPYRSSDGRRLD